MKEFLQVYAGIGFRLARCFIDYRHNKHCKQIFAGGLPQRQGFNGPDDAGNPEKAQRSAGAAVFFPTWCQITVSSEAHGGKPKP